MKQSNNVGELDIRGLIAMVLRKTPESSTVAELMARYESPQELCSATIPELREIKGIGTAKAVQLTAAIELARRSLAAPREPNQIIKCPADVSDLLTEMRYLDREYFKVISLNTKNRVLRIETVAIGTLNSCVVHPREVFKNQVKHSAAAIIIAHNHPSGDPAPSSEDTTITTRLIDAGKILGIEVLDHIIIGNGRYLSFKEKGLM